MSGDEVKAVRGLFGMEQVEFARFMNVDTRTVVRWETDVAAPTGSAIAVMLGIKEGFHAARDSARFINIVRSAIYVGGIAYLIIKLNQLRERSVSSWAERDVAGEDNAK